MCGLYAVSPSPAAAAAYCFLERPSAITKDEAKEEEKKNRHEATIKLFPGLQQAQAFVGRRDTQQRQTDTHISITFSVAGPAVWSSAIPATRNRFIYYVPCDPLVPYPFLFSFSMPGPSFAVCGTIYLYRVCVYIYISRIIFCCSLYVRCALMRGAPSDP